MTKAFLIILAKLHLIAFKVESCGCANCSSFLCYSSTTPHTHEQNDLNEALLKEAIYDSQGGSLKTLRR